MKDMQAHARKIRSDAAECMTLSNLVTEEKRHLFAQIAEHLNSLALEIETEMAANVVDEPAAALNQQVDFADQHAAPTSHQRAARSWYHHPWSIFVALLVTGVVFWAMNRTEMQSFSQASLLPKTESASRDSDQELAALLSREREERKVLEEQLIARLDSLARDLDDLKSLRPGNSVSSSKDVTGRDRSGGMEAKLPAAEQTIPRAETSSPSSETSGTAMAGPPTAAANPVGEPSDRVELDPRKPPVGPVGCTRFRSFDPVSGTYTTFDGRRRQCR